MANCNHRKYIPRLVELTRAGVVDPSALITQIADVHDAVSAYEQFDLRRPGWLKVALDPSAVTAAARSAGGVTVDETPRLRTA